MSARPKYPHRHFKSVKTVGGVTLRLGHPHAALSDIKDKVERLYPQYGRVSAMRIGNVQVYPGKNNFVMKERISPLERLVVLFIQPEFIDLNRDITLLFQSPAGMITLDFVPMEFSVAQIKELISRKYDTPTVKMFLGGKELEDATRLISDYELSTYSLPRVEFSSKDETERIIHLLEKDDSRHTFRKIMREENKLAKKDILHKIHRAHSLRKHILKDALKLSTMAKELRILHNSSSTVGPFHSDHQSLLENLYEMISENLKSE